MPQRLPVISTSEATDEQREALLEWSADRRATTPPAPIWGMLVASPEGMRRVGKLGAFSRFGTTLPDAARETAIFLTSCSEGYKFEIRVHAQNLAALGIEPDIVDGLRRGDADALPSPLREAAHLARAMLGGGEVPQDVFDAAHAQFGDRGIAELAVVIGYFSMLGKLARTFGV